jgi:hypothetical protein
MGIVVDDLDAALAELSELFGYTWCPQMAVETPGPAPVRRSDARPLLLLFGHHAPGRGDP